MDSSLTAETSSAPSPSVFRAVSLRHEPAPVSVQVVTLVGVVMPLAGLISAIALLWGWGFSWVHLGLMLGMYLATTLGVTIGFHRLFTHRSFETTAWLRCVFAVLGSMAFQGSVLKWVAVHRKHHQHSDDVDDPHSPHHHGKGLRGLFAGAWHAHVGWLFDRDARDLSRYVGDLLRDKWLRRLSGVWMLWAVLGLLLPAVLGGLITMSWAGVLLGFLWGGLVRVFLVHHVTWSINSVCHLWGSRPFNSDDESRNNAVFGILGMGEGWHNNHHAFPTSARHGLGRWQIDVSYWIIRGLEAVGLAWKVRVPEPATIMAKKG